MAEITITSENFENEVLKSDKPVLIDFWAPWCNPCKMLSPIISKTAESRTDIKVGKINVDEQHTLAADFGIMSIPTLVIMKNGKAVNSASGFMPQDVLENFINSSL